MIIFGSYDEAERHVSILEDEPLPRGTVYSIGQDFAYVVVDNRGLSNQIIGESVHGIIQLTKVFGGFTEDFIYSCSVTLKNSKEVRALFLTRKAEFLDEEKFRRLEDYLKKNPDRFNSSELKRTCASLEKLIH